MSALHQHLTIAFGYFNAIDVPWRCIDSGMIEHLHPLKPSWKLVEVSLICEALTIQVIVTPLQATFPPPVETRKALRIAAERDPSHVIGTVYCSFLQAQREAMR